MCRLNGSKVRVCNFLRRITAHLHAVDLAVLGAQQKVGHELKVLLKIMDSATRFGVDPVPLLGAVERCECHMAQLGGKAPCEGDLILVVRYQGC